MFGSLLGKEYLCTRKQQDAYLLKAKVQQKIKLCK